MMMMADKNTSLSVCNVPTTLCRTCSNAINADFWSFDGVTTKKIETILNKYDPKRIKYKITDRAQFARVFFLFCLFFHSLVYWSQISLFWPLPFTVFPISSISIQYFLRDWHRLHSEKSIFDYVLHFVPSQWYTHNSLEEKKTEQNKKKANKAIKSINGSNCFRGQFTVVSNWTVEFYFLFLLLLILTLFYILYNTRFSFFFLLSVDGVSLLYTLAKFTWKGT